MRIFVLIFLFVVAFAEKYAIDSSLKCHRCAITEGKKVCSDAFDIDKNNCLVDSFIKIHIISPNDFEPKAIFLKCFY
ncbi:unnamed protein product [Moneuplotes crassus]|uniref:Uncharacterized protein n=1 Tax=Euplotes crassus TaxID=5936 RepID=A0AAD2CX29_EUPCR|nr:unnamed protein product [Moneuplotes crassus]